MGLSKYGLGFLLRVLYGSIIGFLKGIYKGSIMGIMVPQWGFSAAISIATARINLVTNSNDPSRMPG